MYVKDEGANLNSMTTTFKSIVNCVVLGLEESYNPTLVLVMHFPKLINM
jgi:ribosomal protein L6P/L9E